MNKQQRIKDMALLALFLAIETIMTFVPYTGFINIGPITFTLMHLPLIIAAFISIKDATIVGLFFGLLSLLKSFIAPASPMDLFFHNPLISVLPRLVLGLLLGISFHFIKKTDNKLLKNLSLFVAPLLCTLIHTLLVMGSLVLFQPEFMSQNAAVFLGMFFIGGALVEASLAGVVSLGTYYPLNKYLSTITLKNNDQ